MAADTKRCAVSHPGPVLHQRPSGHHSTHKPISESLPGAVHQDQGTGQSASRLQSTTSPQQHTGMITKRSDRLDGGMLFNDELFASGPGSVCPADCWYKQQTADSTSPHPLHAARKRGLTLPANARPGAFRSWSDCANDWAQPTGCEPSSRYACGRLPSCGADGCAPLSPSRGHPAPGSPAPR